MARASSTDYLQSYRFQVVVYGFGRSTAPTLGTKPGTASAGFSACTAPNITQEAVNYREGHYIYTRKFPGVPSLDDITLSRGVAVTDGTFWQWMKRCIEGSEEYRVDLDIFHLTRAAKPGTQSSPSNLTTIASPIKTVVDGASSMITYHLHEAIPTTHKVAGDFDATSSEVSIQEIGLGYEYFDIEGTSGSL